MCETIRIIRAHKFVRVWKNMRNVEDRRGGIKWYTYFINT